MNPEISREIWGNNSTISWRRPLFKYYIQDIDYIPTLYVIDMIDPASRIEKVNA